MLSLIGEIPVDVFLKEYWQKKPLLIRNAIPDFKSPVTKRNLFEMAGEEMVESRIILENHDNRAWQLDNGPFSSQKLSNMPKEKWTLLVQGLDHWVAEAADLLDHFRFIPNWRIDDIMASYAPHLGSVGPHYDQYDVFLVQAEGQRHWRVGQHCDENTPRLTGTPLRIIKEFEETDRWLLNPGDMLYLPPGVAHFGIAQGECITLSVGFRSPTDEEMINDYCYYVTERIRTPTHLKDANLSQQAECGEITADSLRNVKQILKDRLLDDTSIARWFGSYITTPKSEDIVIEAEQQISVANLQELLVKSEHLYWNEGSRFSFILDPDHIYLFADGVEFRMEKSLSTILKRLCAGRKTAVSALSSALTNPAFLSLLVELYNQGSIYLDSYDD
ncbi:MAG: transcription factor [Proteobacteria bacterium]|nr:MAG: transcription factor [Pseudomonadota bacterium]